MPHRADESVRQELYNGHPPYCTCVECQKRRLQRSRRKTLWRKLINIFRKLFR